MIVSFGLLIIIISSTCQGVIESPSDEYFHVELDFKLGKPYITVQNLKWRDISIYFYCYASPEKAIIIRHGGLNYLSITIPARDIVEFEPHLDFGFGFVNYIVQILYDPKGEINLEQKTFLLGWYYFKLLQG